MFNLRSKQININGEEITICEFSALDRILSLEHYSHVEKKPTPPQNSDDNQALMQYSIQLEHYMLNNMSFDLGLSLAHVLVHW